MAPTGAVAEASDAPRPRAGGSNENASVKSSAWRDLLRLPNEKLKAEVEPFARFTRPLKARPRRRWLVCP